MTSEGETLSEAIGLMRSFYKHSKEKFIKQSIKEFFNEHGFDLSS